MIKKIRLEGISEREIKARYQLAKKILDERHVEHRSNDNLTTLLLPLSVAGEEVELF